MEHKTHPPVNNTQPLGYFPRQTSDMTRAVVNYMCATLPLRCAFDHQRLTMYPCGQVQEAKSLHKGAPTAWLAIWTTPLQHGERCELYCMESAQPQRSAGKEVGTANVDIFFLMHMLRVCYGL